MDDIFHRIAGDLIDRIYGPMKFRFLLQPSMAIAFAIRDGIKDAQAGRDPYLFSLLFKAGQRKALLHEWWMAMWRVLLLAFVMDVIYQVIVLHWVYIGEALIVAPMLAFTPYVLTRGPVCRFMRSRAK